MSNIYLKIQSGNKAKEDIDKLMNQRGFRNVSVGYEWHGAVGRFFSKLLSVMLLPFRLHKNDVLLVQYPFKKYYPSLCRIAHFRKAKVVTLIHDLGCFRRKKLTVKEEMVKLGRTDALIVHNDSMLQFMREHGYKRPMITLDIFDYLSDYEPEHALNHNDGEPWDVVYAGGLAERKNRFLYLLDEALPETCCWHLYIHGKGLDEEKAKVWKHITSCGFIRSDEFVKSSVGHFGLVWDGASIDECSGEWGVYLKVNNPHKTSFYLRSGKPVIIWKEAALAKFVEAEGVGIAVNSLRDIDEKLRNITAKDYLTMLDNVSRVQKQLACGYYFDKAYGSAIAEL